MIDYRPLYPHLRRLGQQDWITSLEALLTERMSLSAHGKMPIWQAALDALPEVVPSQIELRDAVRIGHETDIDTATRLALKESLMAFHPWRKGPYHLFGLDIDTEWRSDWKWDRVLPHISDLTGRSVLDVGGGNGYHGWRMAGEEAAVVIGIDPTKVFAMQYWIMQRYIKSTRHFVLPLGIEDLPDNMACFDTVFSMGVLYHRRSPIDHLYDLRACLRSGGELVLETLVIDGDLGDVLMPEQRYAKMRNVWFIPSVETMCLWLRRCGFKDVKCVDQTRTTLDEQRQTDWMQFESLADFLDQEDRTKTVEGYSGPIRATFIATAP